MRSERWTRCPTASSRPRPAHAAPLLCADTATIAACGSHSHWPIALSLFSDMQADGVTPDAYAINAAINASNISTSNECGRVPCGGFDLFPR